MNTSHGRLDAHPHAQVQHILFLVTVELTKPLLPWTHPKECQYIVQLHYWCCAPLHYPWTNRWYRHEGPNGRQHAMPPKRAVGKYQEANASYQQIRRRVAATRLPVSYWPLGHWTFLLVPGILLYLYRDSYDRVSRMHSRWQRASKYVLLGQDIPYHMTPVKITFLIVQEYRGKTCTQEAERIRIWHTYIINGNITKRLYKQRRNEEKDEKKTLSKLRKTVEHRAIKLSSLFYL